jgi:hypothetical protein
LRRDSLSVRSAFVVVAFNASKRRRRRDFLAVLLAVLIAGGTWSTGLAAFSPSAATPAAGEARFERAPCPVEVPATHLADCGYLVVPETRGVRAAGRSGWRC